MMPSRNKSRTPFTLSGSLNNRLNAYVIAAGAAGVTLIALAPALEAEVVYTSANEIIGRQGSYKLDLNHDGLIDYVIAEHAAHYNPYESFQILSLRAAAGNQANCPSSFCISGNTYAAALTLGMPIGNSQHRGWLGQGVPMALEDLKRGGSVYYAEGWVNVNDRYLGLRFQINGETHFGWARLTVKFHGGPPAQRTWEAHLTGYAYETVAGKSLRAGQTNDSQEDESTSSALSDSPGQLGALARGAEAIMLWRRGD